MPREIVVGDVVDDEQDSQSESQYGESWQL